MSAADSSCAPIRVLEQAEPLDALLETALGPAMLEAVRHAGPRLLRAGAAVRTVAFSGRDCVSQGIGRAVESAESHGFAPVRRGPGGRAVAYHHGCLCVDYAGPDEEPKLTIHERFAALTDLLAGALRSLGVQAQVGPVPGEYCEGDYSINDGGGGKLAGTAQRLVPGGWLFSAVIVVTDPDPLRDVLVDVYADLGIEWDPGTVGAVDRADPGASVADVRRAVLDSMAGLGELTAAPLPQSLVVAATSRRDRHRVPGR